MPRWQAFRDNRVGTVDAVREVAQMGGGDGFLGGGDGFIGGGDG